MAQATIGATSQAAATFRRRRPGHLSAFMENWIRRAIARLKSVRQARRADRELMTLDDRQLADIGVRRPHIWYATRHGREWDSRSPLPGV